MKPAITGKGLLQILKWVVLALLIVNLIGSLIVYHDISFITILLLIPFVPVARKWRIALIVGVGIIVIGNSLYVLLGERFVNWNREESLRSALQENGWEYVSHDNFWISDYFKRPMYMSNNSRFGACQKVQNLGKGEVANHEAYIVDCEDDGWRYQQNGALNATGKRDAFTSLVVLLKDDEKFQPFAFVNDGMADESRLNEKPILSGPYSKSESVVKREEQFTYFQLNDELEYARPNVDPYLSATATYGKTLQFPEAVIELSNDENAWWYVEITSDAMHLHKRGKNSGETISASQIQAFLTEAKMALEVILENRQKIGATNEISNADELNTEKSIPQNG